MSLYSDFLAMKARANASGEGGSLASYGDRRDGWSAECSDFVSVRPPAG